ncbi:MAG: lipoprotein-releasing ABC transporter permease subunit [Candidatus Eisenbacteria bacterium]
MYELFVARRYLVPKRGKGFLSLITWISIGGVCLGVLALVVVLAVMNGFENEVKSRIVGSNAHAFVLRFGTEGLDDPDRVLATCEANPEVVAASPFILGKALVSHGRGSDGAAIKGVDFSRESQVTEILKYVEKGPGVPLELKPVDGGMPGIILGVHIADNLQANAGDTIQLLSPRAGSSSPFGFVPKVGNFRLVGVFRSGMYEYDASFAYVDLGQAQSFFGMGSRVSGIELRVKDMYRAPEVAEAVLKALGGFPYRVNDWIQMNSNLFSWMQMEKVVMFVILGLIVLIAAFNITGALIMLVNEKRRDIGILRSLGATTHEIRTIFVLEGFVIGLLGIVLGTSGGLLLCYLLDRYQFIKLPGDVCFIDTLPVDVQVLDVVTVLVAVLLIVVISTLYPAYKAARLDPVDAIRYEG